MYSVDDIYYSTGAPVYKCDERGEVLGKLNKSDINRLEDVEVLRIEPFDDGKKAALKVVLGRRKIR